MMTYWYCDACQGYTRIDARERCARRVLSVTTTARGERHMREVCGHATREAKVARAPLPDQWGGR